ncbi:uncharacterized protein LOC106059703 isoform X1 [Biomphalaria glabrata]|uniref:Uncharacterized protein LOC106059703 isoform X1 n=2 Tax=Biomphalaria glabrata TaxID=6526 RepID=A0A9W2ZET7_BIOGL|nr:uncharacterized protein LOC106059703 isoform X1 [Biomphalaria glabrata]
MGKTLGFKPEKKSRPSELQFCLASLEYIAKASCTDLTFNNKTFSFDENNIALLEMRTAIKNVNPLIDMQLEENKDAISLALLIKYFIKKIMKEVHFEVVDTMEQQELFKEIQESVNNILYFPEKLKTTFIESLTSRIKDKSKLHTKSENRNKLINVEACEYQCAIFGFNENFAFRLSNLGPMGLEHGNILYFFSTWLESYWQEMLSETNHNPYDHESNFKKLGINSDVSEILSRSIKMNVREMQTSLYWAKSYLKTVWFSHPLISQCNNEFLPTEVDKWIECREIIEIRQIELSNKTAIGHIKLFRASKQSKLTDLAVKREYCIENKNVYYHGTEQYCLYGERGKDGILSKGIDLRKGNGKQDFSHRCGFYLSDTLDAAREWGGNKSPNDHCVIVFAIPEELLNAEGQGGLDVTSDDEKWGRVVDYFRNGESNTESNFNDSELNEINNAKFIKGNISKRDKSAYTINNIVVRQICLKEKEYAKRIESCIRAIIFYHTEN